jgi:autotransporter-associated beta strand protein
MPPHERPRPARQLAVAFLVLALASTSGPVHLAAADYYWDTDGTDTGNNLDGTGLGGTGTWNTSTANWWSAAPLVAWPNLSTDRAIFSGPFVAGSPTLNTVTLSSGIIANQLSFLRSGYTLTGGDLTLAGTNAGLHANLGESATISSQILGSAGLTKTGGGSIRLTNASNSYTGTTTIANGSLIINSAAALGGTGTVSILTNNNTPLNTGSIGFGGGSLVLDGTAGGFTFARDVDFEGRGPIGDRGSAILSLGNNTLSGILTSAVSPLPLSPTASFRNSRINSVNGTLTLSGTLSVGGTAGTTVTSLGGVNAAGVGDFSLTGVLTGTGTLEKSGAGTLFLNPSDTSGFSGRLRISSSATGQQSTVRVTSLNDGLNTTSIFGTANGGTTSAPIDMNGGLLEIRSDSSLNFGRNVYQRATNSTVFVGPAAGGSGVNGTATFGTMSFEENLTNTFNSRNGYGVSFTAAPVNGGNANSTITNNMGGDLSFTGNFWSNTDNGAARTMTIGGNGNTVINGNIVASAAAFDHVLTKTGTGSLTITGTGSTLDGAVNVQGSLAITDFRSINNNTSNITLSNGTTTVGNLIIGTAVTPTAGGLTTSRPIVLNGTTVSPSIYANQTGGNPVILNGSITRPAATTGGLILGGTNTADNSINVGIPNAGTGGLLKTGPGTWVLAGTNAYTGATNIVNGTLKIKANAPASTIFAATHDITFGNSNVFAGGTLEFVGQDGVNNVQTLDVLTTSSGASTIRLTPGVGGTASLTFASQATGAAGTVNFVGADFVNNKITITGGNGLISRTNYWEGADFAYRESNVLRAPVYGTDTGFETSASALTAAANMEITGSFAANTVSISTLKIAGSHTLTLNAAQTVTLSNGGVLVTGGDAIITGGTALALGTQALVVRTNLDTDSLDIQSVVTGSGGLTKSGAGTLILSGVNTQTGTVTINEGTVQLSGSGRLGAAAALTMRQGTVLDLNGVTPSTNTNAFNNNGSVTSASPASFTVGGADGTGTSFGTVNGAISLTKIGTGGQSWLGNSTYTGVTTIGSTGLVTVDTLTDGGTPSGIGASTNAASNLVFNGSTGGLVYAGNIRNGELILGSRSASTDRLFTLSGTGARLSSTVSNNNAIVWSNTGAIVHGIVGPQLLTFEGTSTGDNTFNPQLTDSGVGANITSVTKTGTGQWNLGNSNNTYTGTTTVGDGILALNHTGALPATSPLVLGSTTTSGILQTSGTFTRNLATTPTAGTGTITWGGTTGGGGFAAHATPLTVTLNGGAGLTWGSGGFVGTGGTQALIFGSATAATATGLSDVTFTNAIDLGAVSRTITVNDNTNTGADYATVSGVLSGTGGGVTKTGNGILRLGNANTYTGTTEVQAGTVVVQSLGSSSGAGSSSVGAGGVTMDNSNAVVLGNATTTGGILQYVGPGETSDRKIRLRGTTANNQIHADGSGALILTNVAHDTTETGNKTLSLRGSNTAGNMITSALTDNGAGVLSVTVDGGATWILTGTNTFTGNLTSSAGALGIGNAAAVGAGTLVNSNGNIFAYGADRTITNALTLSNNTTNGWLGDYSLTFTGTNNLAAAANNVTTTNSIVAGKTLTFQGVTANALTGNRAWVMDGPGETVINGNFTTSTAFGMRFDVNGGGTLTLGTNGATSNFNQSITAVDVDRGTLKFSANNAIPTASAAYGGVTLSPELATGDTATLNLNGTTQTVNALTATSDGTIVIDNTSASAATFRFGANDTAIAFGGTTNGTVPGTGSYTITDTGTGALSIVKLGNTSTTFGSHVVLTHQGTTGVEGGTLNVAANLNGTTGLIATNSGSAFNLTGGAALGASAIVSASGGASINASVAPVTFGTNSTISATGSGSALTFTGGIGNASNVVSLTLENGTALSLLDGAGSKFTNLTTLQLGSTGGSMTTLNLNVGDQTISGDELFTDTLTLLTGGTLTLFSGNQITFNLTDAGLNPSQTYDLISVVDGGLTAGVLSSLDWLLGSTPGGFSSITLNVTDTLIQLQTGPLITGDLFWRGIDGGGTDNTWNAGIANWSQDKANTIAATTIPGQGTDVIFAIDGGAGAYSTTLEQNFKINSLTFEAGSPALTSVTIAPGTVATNRLEIAPQVATDGIATTAGGPASVTISTPLRLGADQTWTVADSGSTITLSGGLQGEKDVTKAGAGKVILSAAADPAFNGGQTADFTVNAGTLETTNVGALGTSANSNAANVAVNSGGAFYYNGVTSTVNNNLTLGGGTLSAGTANQTYGGTVNVSGNSFINMADSNGPATNTARNITFSGLVSGSGSLTIDSNNGASSGNQINGTLTMNNAGNTWSGDLIFNEGTVLLTSAASPSFTANDVIFNTFGRLQLQGVSGQTLNRTGTLNFGAGSISEFSVDTTGTVTTDFIVNQNGAVTLGSGGTGASVRVFAADTEAKLNINGGVTLGGNSSISVGSNAARLLTISGVIDDGGNGYSLAINDDAGGWGVTNGTVQLNNANTYTGGTTLASGTLILGNTDALSTGPLTVTGASTLHSLVDLTGLNALSNPLNLSAVLTFTGSNGITFDGLTTNIGAGGITNSLSSGNLLFDQVNLAESGAVAARTLTVAGASTGGTTITTLLNNDQNNTLTNNLSAATLMIGTIALSESAGTGRTLTLGGTGNTTVTGVIENVAGGGGAAGTLTKAGAGTLQLDIANTYTGGTNLGAGTLRLGHKDAIGTGTLTVTGSSTIQASVDLSSGGAGPVANPFSIGAFTLTFSGSEHLTLSGAGTLTGAPTFSANGTGGATITYNGAISAAGNNFTLAGATGSEGIISGGITQTGDTADATVSGGTWTHTSGTSRVADTMTVTGTGTILNLNSGLFQLRNDLTVTANGVLNLNGTGVLSFSTATLSADASLRATAGGVINLGANNAVVVTDFDGLRIGTDAAGIGTLNMGTFNQSVTDFILGNRQADRSGIVNGTGTLTTTGNIDLYGGTVNANLGSTGAVTLDKISLNTVTLAGDNSALAGTGATVITEGTLILDYSSNTATKVRAASALDMRGSNLTLNGNASSAVAQSVASFTLGSGGNSIITLNTAGGQDLVLNLNAITRAINAQDGTVRFNLPSGTQSATNGITTDTLNTLGTGTNAILGGWATVNDGTGTFFARNLTNAVDGNIVAAVTTLQDDVSLWLSGENISDSTGFTGTRQPINITSLRFNAAAGSDLTLASAGVLGITSGGVLVTSNVGGTPTLMNGTIFSGAQASNVPELIVTQDSAATFELGADLRTNSAFTKSGSGTVLLSGNNVYTGTTEIQNGTLQLGGGNAVGDTSLVTLSATRNSTLELLADETIGRLQGGVRQTDQDLGMVNVGTHTLTINQSANTTYSGRFNGSGVIVLNAGSTGNLNYAGQTSTGLFTGSVIVNGGLFQLSGDTARLGSATSFTINGSGSFLLDNNATANTTDRISDSATFTLNSAAGAFSSETRPRGLANRNDDNDNSSETIGALTFNSGANYASLEASGGTSAQANIIASGWTRNNDATVIVRGRNLGGTSAERTQFRVLAANDGPMLAENIGGGGVIGGTAKNVSIVPWAIGENLTGGLADGNMGNSLVSYVDDRGFVALNLTNEYSTFGTAAVGDNVRESLGADLTGIVGTTINALVLNNTAVTGLDVTGSGAGQTLAVTSGAFLFTVTGGVASTAYDTTLGGFDSGITVGGTNEYVISVVNPSSAATTSTLTATIASPLTSSADITKSGRGTLILTGTNTAGGGANKTTLNEGLLQISDLDNIGGNSGSLVFAGGGLRFGAGLTDDISLRTISILQGGATLDTNGIDLALANSVGSGVGGLTKTGLGNLTLNGTATYTGNTVLSVGTITVGAANALGNGGNLTLAGGTTLALGTNSLTHGLVTTSGASPAITGTGTINAATGFFLNHTGDTTIDAVLAGTGGVLKAQSNVVTLTGLNTYTGTTEIQAGTLSINSIANVGGGASALGAPTTAENGIIRMGLTTTATTLTYTGSGHTSDRLIGMQGTTGGVTLNGNGTGAVGYGGARFENAGNKTLTLGGTSASGVNNSLGGLQEIGGVLTLTKSGANTWVLTGPSDYTGNTTVQDGILRFAADKTTTSGTLTLGTASTAGSLELTTGSAAFTTMSVLTNSSSLTNNLVVNSGETLTLSGNVTIGANAAASTTLFNATGGGSFANINSGGTFQVGGGTGNTNVNAATADFSGLANFTVDLGPTGTFRVGDNNTNSAGTLVANSTLILASTANTITAGTLNIGQGAGQGASVQTLTLGAGTNVINADTINIGGNTTRSGGAINFAGATGSVTVRAADGTSRAVVNMTNGAISTGFNQVNDFLLAGHTADVFVSTLTMASRSASTGFATATLTFDQGTLDVTTLNMASRTGAGTGNATATLDIGGGTANIGAVNMAVNTSSGGTVTADLNVTGGNVTIGPINMANAGTGRTVTSTVDLTGGTVTVTGNITRTGGAGTENETLTLNGSTLNMSGNSIGSGGTNINFAAESGTLINLGELNGGGTFTKTTAGTLEMGNGNTYTGNTVVSGGTLLANNTSGSATGTGTVTVASGGTLGGSGSISGDTTIQSGGTLTGGTNGTVDSLDFGGNLTMNSGSTWLVDLAGATADQILLSLNTATLDLGTATLAVNTLDTAWTLGQVWTIASFFPGQLSGTFFNLNDGDTLFASGSGGQFQVNYNNSLGTVTLTAVPEPSTVITLILLLALGAWIGRKRWLRTRTVQAAGPGER